MAKVVLAMSGGVDSSVAAHLLCQAGHEVIGVFMRHGEASPVACSRDEEPSHLLPILPAKVHKQGCCSASDAQDARRVADRFSIPFYALDFAEEFGQIMDYFVDEYTRARTPNPCVVCNTWLKFGKLFEYADSVGAEFVATGHYARIVREGIVQPPALCRGIDGGKDQAYVLFGIAKKLLPRMLLPVGDFRKTEIRQIATQLGMNVADKPDSQEICFVPQGDYAAFIRARRGESASQGEIVTTDGRVVGEHDGLEQFTIGQRKGLGVAMGDRWYVVRLEPETSRVVLGTKEELARQEVVASQVNWLVEPPREPLACEIKIRYNSPPAKAALMAMEDGRIQATSEEPLYGVAPGQALVCFSGDRVLCGGWID
jgi:tRNA-specific 2-thiouridylase